MKLLPFVAALLAWPSPAAAATDPGPPLEVSAEARAECDRLAEEASAALTAHYKEARERNAAAEAAGEEPEPYDTKPVLQPFVERFRVAAAGYAGTDDAVPFLAWIVKSCGFALPDEARAAFELIVESHAASPAVEPLARWLPNAADLFEPERVGELFARLEAATPDETVRDWASYARHRAVVKNAPMESEAYAESRAALFAIGEKIEKLAQTIRIEIGSREHFSLGMVAPNITGLDLDGVEFSLSDFEGKIVFLDFWGDW